jgi:hypothetical protein
MSSSKKLICKGTLRPVFIRVYRLEIHSVMLVFSTPLSGLLPNKPRRGGGLRHLPQSPFTDQFFLNHDIHGYNVLLRDNSFLRANYINEAF